MSKQARSPDGEAETDPNTEADAAETADAFEPATSGSESVVHALENAGIEAAFGV